MIEGMRIAPRRIAAALAVVLASVAGAAAAGTAAAAEDVVAEVRRHTERYQDVARARADGFVAGGGMVALHGIHFVNPTLQLRAATLGLDLAQPPMLLYVEREGAFRLAGVEYALPARPEGGPLPASAWHVHEASCHYRDDLEWPATRAQECPLRHPGSNAPFVLWHPALAVAHVWAWIENPAGPFAPTNAALAPWGGTPESHNHARTEAEAAYSTLNHHVAGAFLLVIAIVVWWERRRPRRLPWAVASAPLWMAFSVYLFLSVDPEAWPIGPGSIADALADPLVLQHKMLSFIPLLIGVMDVLGRAGWLRSPRWRLVLPGLTLLGGSTLFLHSHHGEIHLDRMFFHHALMGAAAIAGACTLYIAQRSTTVPTLMARAWPGLLATIALLLLVYSEG
jgi:hypothetical protein